MRSARLAWSIAFSGSLWWIVAERSGLVLDTRWIPGARTAARPHACVYLLLTGTFAVHGRGAKVIEAPAALVLSEEDLEGADGARSLTYRSEGEPFTALQIHLPAAMLAVDPSPDPWASPRTFDLAPAVWRAARDVALACRSSADASLEPMRRLMPLLVKEGLVREEATHPAFLETPAAIALLWRGFRPMVERLYLTPTVEEVSSTIGISVRQVDRHISEFLGRFGLGGKGWRLAMRHMRLKIAVLFLSAEGTSIADVAKATSYGSVDAMARAFRDAGLPPPSKVQAALRSPSG